MPTTDPHRLDGRRYLLTGAARGIGRATALVLAEAGAQVYAVDVLEDGLADLAQELAARGTGHHTRVFDLRDTAGIAGLCRDGHAALGGLDGLAHVAGVIVRRGHLDEVTEADWDLQVDVNLKATFFLDREVARLLGDDGGSIVNFASQGWWTGGYGGSVVYSATKGGVVSLTRGLARSLAGRSVRVNAIAPGAVDTAMMSEGMSAEAREQFLAQVPLGRIGTPEEQAHAVRFLLSDAASYLTGTTLNVSGGQLVY